MSIVIHAMKVDPLSYPRNRNICLAQKANSTGTLPQGLCYIVRCREELGPSDLLALEKSGACNRTPEIE